MPPNHHISFSFSSRNQLSPFITIKKGTCISFLLIFFSYSYSVFRNVHKTQNTPLFIIFLLLTSFLFSYRLEERIHDSYSPVTAHTFVAEYKTLFWNRYFLSDFLSSLLIMYYTFRILTQQEELLQKTTISGGWMDG